jgi:transcriptional regulator with XRE-family HTH domain
MDNGERLRIWRDSKGLSQQEAAKLVRTKQRTWASWEHDGATPEIDFAEDLERVTDGFVAMRDWARSRRRQRLKGAA